ncbi:MAG TPA: EF-P beta-lysylation protein EpmB, partial [Chromatiaceae bacterium]|nr:EF-P beta-lysylation protein EpmB [Chromatiaceae bacterium]
MIPLSASITKTESWQMELAHGFRSPRELLSYLELDALWDPGMEEAANHFPLRVPHYFAALMTKGNPADPLLRQVLPVDDELSLVPGFTMDPTGDQKARQGPGLLMKYHGRALLLATGRCAINCRYCFRRHYPHADQQAHPGNWKPVLSTLRKDASFSEVILSGGDPLLLSNSRLAGLIGELERLPHLRRLRIHSRLPVVLPDRINATLVDILANTRLKCALVIHANHPLELTPQLGRALAPLFKSGITLLNQSVLLRQVNDDPEIQTDLCELLFDYNVLPYYLHLLDKVEGAARFEVPEYQAQEIYQHMRQQLPG